MKPLRIQDTINRVQWPSMEQEKIFANHISDTWLIAKVCKELLQFNKNNKTSNLTIKWTERLNRHFSKEAHKWPASTQKEVQCRSTVGKRKSKSQGNTTFYQSKTVTMFKKVLARMWGTQQHSNAVGGNVKRLRGKENRTVLLKKLKTGLSYDPAIPLLSTYPTELKQGLEEVCVHIHLLKY